MVLPKVRCTMTEHHVCILTTLTHLVWLLNEESIETSYIKGVGEVGAYATPPPSTFKSRERKWVCAPPFFFGQIKCSNFAIRSYFVVKNAKFSSLAPRGDPGV